MFCRNCGNKCSDSAKFCNMCGTPISGISEPSGTESNIAEKGEEISIGKPIEEDEPVEMELINEEEVKSEPIPVMEDAVDEKRTEAKKQSVVGRGFSLFFSVILMVLLASLSLVLILRITCSEMVGDTGMSGIIEDVNLSDIPIGEIVKELDIEGIEVDKDDELADVIYDTFKDARVDVSSKSKVKRLLDSVELGEFLDEIKDDYVKVMTGEKSSACIEVDQVIEFIEDNDRVISDVLDSDIDDEDYEYIERYLNRNDFEEMTTVEMPENSEKISDSIRLVIGDSIIPYIILGIGIAVLLLLLWVSNLRKKRRVLLYIGISTVIAAVAGFSVSMLKGYILSGFIALDSSLLDSLLAGVGNLINKNSFIFLVIGIGFSLAFVIFELKLKISTRKKM